MFTVFGLLYVDVEMAARAFRGELIGIRGLGPMSLAGWTSVWMFLISGLAAYLVSCWNRVQWYSNQRVIIKAIVGGLTILSVEFTSGLVFNVSFHLGLWSYAHKPFNLMGQICLQSGVGFFGLTPLILWFDALVRHKLFGEPRPRHSLGLSYKSLFTLGY